MLPSGRITATLHVDVDFAALPRSGPLVAFAVSTWGRTAVHRCPASRAARTPLPEARGRSSRQARGGCSALACCGEVQAWTASVGTHAASKFQRRVVSVEGLAIVVDACGVTGPLRRECSTSEKAVQVTSAGRVLWVAAPRLLRWGELRAHLASDPRAVCVLASLSLCGIFHPCVLPDRLRCCTS